MKALASSGASLLVDGAGRPPGLVVGAFVSVRVVESLGGGLFRVSIGGKPLSARSDRVLAPGSQFRALVESAGGSFLLRALRDGGGGAASVIARAGLPNDQASRGALAALLREGIAPEERRLSRVRRAALRDIDAPLRGSGSRDEARTLAARLEAKGIAADLDKVEALSSQSWADEGEGGLEGGSDGGLESGSGDAGGGTRGNSEDKRGALDLNTNCELGIEEDKLPIILGSFLRDLAMRAGGEEELLQIFNHSPGPEGSWVLLPFRFELDSVAFSGSFRLQLPCIRGGAGRIEASFLASSGGSAEPWSFTFSYDGRGGKELRIVPGDAKPGDVATTLFPALEAELSAIGCAVSLKPRDEGALPVGLDLDA